MADLSGDDRGQLLLVGAFIIAAAFVVLALVVNSAIFTENLATRDDVPGSQDALEYRDEVRQGVGAIIEDTNQNNTRTEADAKASVAEFGAITGLDQSIRNRVVSVSHGSTAPGIKIAQDQSRELTSNGSVDDWTLATDVDRTRNVQFNITNLDLSADFRMILNDSVNQWTMSVQESGSDEATISVELDNGTTASCTRDASSGVTIDVTGATANDEPCPALSRLSDGTEMAFGTGVGGGYNVSFANGDDVEGTYSMILEDDGTASANDLGGANFGDPPAEPYYVGSPAVIYSMTVHYEFYTPQVGYEADVRVAPGEVGS
jgi:hypothetical protein